MGWLRKHFLGIDPRTLGLTRILLALLLLLDLGKRAAEIQVWYDNSGLLPNHTGLWRSTREFQYSFFWGFSRWEEAAVGFALCGLVYLGFLVGYRTRWMHALSLLCIVSLQARVDILSNGGDFVLCLLMWWTVFLPMGQRFSVDAWREGGGQAPENAPVVSLAVLAAHLQLAVIYFFNTVHKNGVTWREGSAVHWVLQQERIITAFGVWARENLPPTITGALTYGTLAAEGLLPLLILSPWGRPWTRRLAIVSIWALHLGIATMNNLGLFSLVMCVFASLLVSREDWEALARWRGQATTSELSAPPPGDLRGLRVGAWARELAVVFLMVVATGQVLVENRAVPAAIKPVRLPTWMRATVGFTRMQQGWSMFAPDAPRSEMSVVVDAVTADGRHIDPYNEVASRSADPGLRQVPVRPSMNVYWTDYTMRIPRTGSHHLPLKQWILAHHRRTGRPEDRIVRFNAYVVEQDGSEAFPPVAQRFRHRRFLSGSAPTD